MEPPDYSMIGIRELRQNASRYVDTAQNGQLITVTKHGRPVGRLVPVDGPERDDLEWLVTAGELLAPTETGSILDLPIAHASPDAPSGKQVLDDIRGDRL